MMNVRVYLDTGDPNRIADGREDESIVRVLRAAMVDAGAALVVSRAHIQDVFSQADAPTKERFVAMIESF